MQQKEVMPTDMKVLMNHIYEYKKGVRRMVLFTFNERFESFAVSKLKREDIDYIILYLGCHVRLRHLCTVRTLL